MSKAFPAGTKVRRAGPFGDIAVVLALTGVDGAEDGAGATRVVGTICICWLRSEVENHFMMSLMQAASAGPASM